MQVFTEIRKVIGEEYEPDTLSGIKRNIQRHLSETTVLKTFQRTKNLKLKSKKVLAAKQKNLVNEAGKGNKRALRPFSDRMVTCY